MDHPVTTVERLERELRATDPASSSPISGPDLGTIHRLGSRRRRLRRAGAVGAGLATAAVLVGALSVTGVVGTPAARDTGFAGTPEPTAPETMTRLAQRALDEIPGAVQVSRSQVVLPGGLDKRQQFGTDEPVPGDAIDAGPFVIGGHRYDGVTSYDPSEFPAWLWNGVERAEKAAASPDGSYEVGSTDTGILVDAGELGLACVRPLPEWGGEPDDPCAPALLSGAPGDWHYLWGMGTDDFLEEGKPLELFSTHDYSTGEHREIWIGGTDGTDVASVELVGVDGERVDATVASGTLVEGETMFWGALHEDIAEAITRDASGTVLERHEVRPCSSGVDCEVR